MIISRIKIKLNVYYNLHSEQTVTGTFIDESGSCVFEEVLTQTTIDNIITECTLNSTKKYYLILDFKYINDCQVNIKKKIIKLIGISKLVILTNISNKLIDDMEVGIFNNSNNIISSEGYEVYYLSNRGKAQIESNSEKLFENEFVIKLKTHVEKKSDGTDILHDSSSVYLTSYINIKSFISKEKSFFIYTIYQLAMKMKNHWVSEIRSIDDNEKPTLICQNLNSSFITSVLSSLLKLDILILDKIGPINKLYSILDKKIDEGKKYIVVSDLVCLGTEIKIVKNLIEFLGGKYIGNVSILRIETLLPIDKSFLDTECVFSINKDNNKEIGYEIKTALNY